MELWKRVLQPLEGASWWPLVLPCLATVVVVAVGLVWGPFKV